MTTYFNLSLIFENKVFKYLLNLGAPRGRLPQSLTFTLIKDTILSVQKGFYNVMNSWCRDLRSKGNLGLLWG
jgi:hypothetical protein